MVSPSAEYGRWRWRPPGSTSGSARRRMVIFRAAGIDSRGRTQYRYYHDAWQSSQHRIRSVHMLESLGRSRSCGHGLLACSAATGQCASGFRPARYASSISASFESVERMRRGEPNLRTGHVAQTSPRWKAIHSGDITDFIRTIAGAGLLSQRLPDFQLRLVRASGRPDGSARPPTPPASGAMCRPEPRRRSLATLRPPYDPPMSILFSSSNTFTANPSPTPRGPSARTSVSANGLPKARWRPQFWTSWIRPRDC